MFKDAVSPSGVEDKSERKLGNSVDLTEEGAGINRKRKLEGVIDLTEDEDVDKCKFERESVGAAGASSNKAADKNEPSAQSKVFHASDDHQSRKKEKVTEAQSAQTGQNPAQEQLLFECGTCRKTFESIAEFAAHDTKHKHDPEHKQPPPVRCRRCRKTFKDIAERNLHFQTSPRHFCCRYCHPVVVEFSNADSLRYHYIDRHIDLYCHTCDLHFPTPVQRQSHLEGGHRLCYGCHKVFPVPELRLECCRICYLAKHGKEASSQDGNNGDGEALPDHYAWLGIGKDSSHEQVLKAAKEMRVKTHPDRLKRREGLTEEEMTVIDKEAALVGQAADVLSDPELRYRYDCKMRGW